MISDDLVKATRKRITLEKKVHPLDELRSQVNVLTPEQEFPFETCLKQPQLTFICEIKKASPSKGQIVKQFDYKKIAHDYERDGVDAISFLTEPKYFQGNLTYLTAVHKEVSLPLLRKDFTIDPYMIYQAKLAGASSILLIVAILTNEQLRCYLKLADQLGLSAIVEAHDETEIQRGLNNGARIIGVNNRNLKDFTVDLTTSQKLREFVPDDILYISESGIQTREDVDQLRHFGVDAVLIGETMMRAKNKKQTLQNLKGES